MEWARLLTYITGTVDQEVLLRNEYLATENRILRAQIKGRLLLSDADKKTLAEVGHRIGRNIANLRRTGRTTCAIEGTLLSKQPDDPNSVVLADGTHRKASPKACNSGAALAAADERREQADCTA